MPHLLLNFNTEHLRNITLTLHAHLQLTLTLLEEHLNNYKETCKDTRFFNNSDLENISNVLVVNDLYILILRVSYLVTQSNELDH